MAKLKQQTLLDEGDMLNLRQRQAADEYLSNGGNRYKAYIAAYGPKKTRAAADVAAAKLFSLAKMQAYLSKKRDDLSNKTLITAEKVLRELARIAFLDPRKLFAADGSPKQILELDDDTAAAVAGLEVFELFEGSGDQKHAYGLVKKIKIADKHSALQDLGKYLRLFTERSEISGPNGGPIEQVASVTVDL